MAKLGFETKVKDTAKRNVRCILTKDETLEKAQILSKANRDLLEVADQKKTVVSELKGKEERLNGEIKMLSEHISNGYVYRDVECEITYHAPVNNVKSLTRKDTGESFTEPMSSDEINLFTLADKA